MSTGVLLVQLGTPRSPALADVRNYLREFLSDPRVITLPAPLRWLLVNGVIAPFRARRSAAAYRKIWGAAGKMWGPAGEELASPLLFHSEALRAALQAKLGAGFRVALGMRYGAPKLSAALHKLIGCRRIIVLPLFPQTAESTTGSAIARVRELHRQLFGKDSGPPLTPINSFADNPGFASAVAAVVRPLLAESTPDHVLFSYHGLPESHVRAQDRTGAHCLARADCCEINAPPHRECYRGQCFATTRAVARLLDLPAQRYSTAFQSRLAGARWIAPYTDKVLPQLAADGAKKLLVLCPSFAADCLETLEEIGLRARAQWRECGGEQFALAPCVNASPAFVDALAALARAHAKPL